MGFTLALVHCVSGHNFSISSSSSSHVHSTPTHVEFSAIVFSHVEDTWLECKPAVAHIDILASTGPRLEKGLCGCWTCLDYQDPRLQNLYTPSSALTYIISHSLTIAEKLIYIFDQQYFFTWKWFRCKYWRSFLPLPPPPKRLNNGFDWPGGLQINASNATL